MVDNIAVFGSSAPENIQSIPGEANFSPLLVLEPRKEHTCILTNSERRQSYKSKSAVLQSPKFTHHYTHQRLEAILRNASAINYKLEEKSQIETLSHWSTTSGAYPNHLWLLPKYILRVSAKTKNAHLPTMGSDGGSEIASFGNLLSCKHHIDRYVFDLSY